MTVTAREYLPVQFNISSINTVVSPQQKTAWNQFDEHGLVLSTARLPGEANWEYKRRLLDVFTNISNSSYRGLINGITRELGLSLFTPIQLNPKVSSFTGKFLSPDPYIKFDGTYLYLYSNYSSGVYDYRIDRMAFGGNYEHLGRLINFINSTTYFEASVTSVNIDPFMRSMVLINQSNRSSIIRESIQPSTRFKLNQTRLVRGSLDFSDKQTFKTEVVLPEFVTSTGKYYVDYHNGIIHTYSVPQESIINYQYTIYPFKPIASEVILHDLSNENFKHKMFQQITNSKGETFHGMPTELGVDLINEILSVTPMYMGE